MAKPKLALIPAAQGSKFYSVLPSSGVGDFTFSRSGSATRINSQGLIETVADGVSRLNYPLIDGEVVGCPHHILEPTRTNLLQYSEDFSQSYWVKTGASVTSGFTSPDGSLSADLFNINNPSGEDIVSKTFSFISGVKTNISIFVKDNDFSNQLILGISSNLATITYDFSTQTILSSTGSWLDSVNITKGFNGFNRIDFTINPTFNSFAVFQIRTNNQGNGSFYIYGAQLEQGSYPTSYIPNYGNAAGVTRSAETATGSGDASTFNSSEGVLMLEISALENTDTSNRFISILNGTNANNGFYLFYGGATNRIRFQYNTSTENFNFITTDFNSENNNKIAFKYKSNDISIWVNGIEVKTDTTISSTPVGLDNLSFNRSGSEPFFGNTKQIQYYDSALTDSELETLTSWVSFQEMANGQLYSIQ